MEEEKKCKSPKDLLIEQETDFLDSFTEGQLADYITRFIENELL